MAQVTRTGRIIIASTRAAAGVYDDRSGPMISEWFVQQGFSKPGVVVVPDGDPVGRALRIAVSDNVDVVITSGGTGISPTDETPAQTKPLLDY
ncbi:MAG TPA: molybdopterin-binding protein, partial [Mycobacterium sp.]|nr:molybdopterin-binding protein [Mycobacterium sp.]